MCVCVFVCVRALVYGCLRVLAHVFVCECLVCVYACVKERESCATPNLTPNLNLSSPVSKRTVLCVHVCVCCLRAACVVFVLCVLYVCVRERERERV